LCFRQGAIEARRRPNHFADARERVGRGPSDSLWRDKVRAPNGPARMKRAGSAAPFIILNSRERTCMAASAAYLIALALTLLILVVLWEGFS
jgi:hypothetical protein